ncbi:glycosyltransferase family 2 protein [Streptomyces sp. 8L]|uniref:glycosyltransferase family 2 protein n=1 Tax=Streptomyces sp. 8L TaxID=2877242 RepID=UPI001CD49867|nr:glycosyltransferase family 2 protein [Streptomyces sp. 8L]MCA1219177.1 glycosyltransferase [Streptomyces sp. 8L]
MQVSIVVAVRGNTGALGSLARAVRAQDHRAEDVELVVVDNHPVPVLPPGAYRLGPMPCRVVHEARPGLSRARNAGIRQAHGEVVLITDPDARPEPDWVRRMASALEATGAYCAAGRVVPYFTGGAIAVAPDVLQLFVPPVWPELTTELTAPYWAVGCNLAIRRSPLPQFDTRLGVTGRRHLSCEELEFTVRAQAGGRRVVVVPDAVVHRAIHPADLTAGALWARALWHGASMARLLALHPGSDIYDSYRLRDALAPARLRSRTGRRGAMADIARVVGLRTERLRLATSAGLNAHTAGAEKSAAKGANFHG